MPSNPRTYLQDPDPLTHPTSSPSRPIHIPICISRSPSKCPPSLHLDLSSFSPDPMAEFYYGQNPLSPSDWDFSAYEASLASPLFPSEPSSGTSSPSSPSRSSSPAPPSPSYEPHSLYRPHPTHTRSQPALSRPALTSRPASTVSLPDVAAHKAQKFRPVQTKKWPTRAVEYHHGTYARRRKGKRGHGHVAPVARRQDEEDWVREEDMWARPRAEERVEEEGRKEGGWLRWVPTARVRLWTMHEGGGEVVEGGGCWSSGWDFFFN